MYMKPVIKWAGGKGFLVDTVKDMQPKGYKRYYEPFAGGAAVLLGLQPTAATLNDITITILSLSTSAARCRRFPCGNTWKRH